MTEYNLFDFDLDAYKEATKPVNLMGGFLNWQEHSHEIEEE